MTFQVSWLFGCEEEKIIDFEDGGHVIFKSTCHIDASYQVSSQLSTGVEAKIIFSRWMLLWPSWIADKNDLSYLHPPRKPCVCVWGGYTVFTLSVRVSVLDAGFFLIS